MAINHVYRPWIVAVTEKYWDQLSEDGREVPMDRANKSHDFKRQDTRAEAGKTLVDLKARGMQINRLTHDRTNRIREKLSAVSFGIAADVGEEL